MPRNGSGVASAPPGTTATPNTTILSSAHNSLKDDIYALMNTAWPVSLGGTGGTSAQTSVAALFPGTTYVLDENLLIADNGDTTKRVKFQVSGVTTATTRTLTVPDASGTVMLTDTAVSNAQALTGSVVQSAYAEYTGNADFTSIIPVDDTTPLISEGGELLSVVGFTPRSTTNRIRVRFSGWGSAAELNGIVAAIFAGSTCLAAAQETVDVANYRRHVDITREYVPGSVSPVTFVVRVGPATAGTIRFNGTSSGRLFGGVSRATLVVEELKA